MKLGSLKKVASIWLLFMLAFVPILTSCDEEKVGENEFFIKGVEISGTVSDTEGNPVDNAQISLKVISFTMDGLYNPHPYSSSIFHPNVSSNEAGKYSLKESLHEIYLRPGKEFCDSLWVICEPPADSGLQKDSVILVLKESLPDYADEVNYKPATVNFVLK